MANRTSCWGHVTCQKWPRRGQVAFSMWDALGATMSSRVVVARVHIGGIRWHPLPGVVLIHGGVAWCRLVGATATRVGGWGTVEESVLRRMMDGGLSRAAVT